MVTREISNHKEKGAEVDRNNRGHLLRCLLKFFGFGSDLECWKLGNLEYRCSFFIKFVLVGTEYFIHSLSQPWARTII